MRGGEGTEGGKADLGPSQEINHVRRGSVRKAKVVIGIGIVVVLVISIWTGIASNPISGIASFFILTFLLWAVAKNRHWI